MICFLVTAPGVFCSPNCKIPQHKDHLPVDCTLVFMFIFTSIFSASLLKLPLFFLIALLGCPFTNSFPLFFWPCYGIFHKLTHPSPHNDCELFRFYFYWLMSFLCRGLEAGGGISSRFPMATGPMCPYENAFSVSFLHPAQIPKVWQAPCFQQHPCFFLWWAVLFLFTWINCNFPIFNVNVILLQPHFPSYLGNYKTIHCKFSWG